MRIKHKKVLSLLLSGIMLFSLCSQSVAAVAGTQTGSSITVGTGGLCEHHPEHDDECGYMEGEAGTPCAHEHTDDCYTEVIKCVHEHDEDCYPEESIWDDEATPSDADRWEPEYCPHICDEESGCITKKLNCQHKHDNECGYSSATRGTPCDFVCEICDVENDMKTATSSNAKAVTVAGVQAMIDALPDAEEIRKDNAEKVKAQLDAIDDAKAEFSDEEIDELDLSRYMEVAAALEQLLYGVATQSNAVMLADYDGPAIQLGTGGISGPTEVEVDGKGSYYAPNSYVYYGENSSIPIKWRVLDADSANDGTTSGMFLLAEYSLVSKVKFHSIDYGSGYYLYQGSDAQKWCSSFATGTDYFSATEQEAMLGIEKNDSSEDLYSISWGTSSLTASDKVFFLSVQELADYVGNYNGAPGMAATDTARNEELWWLRSYNDDNRGNVGMIYLDGEVGSGPVNSPNVAVRPALNLNLDSILFTSAAENAKVDAAVDSNLTEVGTGSAEWKLTLKDTSRSFSASASNTLVRAGKNLTVTYSGAGTGENEYVSAMIADNNGNVLYYGRIAQNSESGTASVIIPSDLAVGNYTLKVFSEQCNGDCKTDYASEFQDISLTVQDKIKEQFDLITGGTYWFDLSGVGIPGDANAGGKAGAASLPDTSLHWVPFTWVGTIDAYKLADASDSNTTSYAHSLFIVDYNVVYYMYWYSLRRSGVIFGKDYTSSGIDYILRAPSAGQDRSGSGEMETGTPINNEWDAILEKADQDWLDNTAGYIKNWYKIFSWGQDIYSESTEEERALRGYNSANDYFWCHPTVSAKDYGYRPVLEVLNPGTLGSDGLKAVMLDLNGGSIGGSTGTVNIVVKNGESFTAPASNGLTRPAGNTDDYFWWQGSDGNSYVPGTDVPAGVTSLTAQWTVLTYKVTLNTNGGAIADGKDVISYTYGEGAALPTANDMTREGYIFSGWYADSSFSGSPVTAISSIDMGNKQFYAKWARNTTPITPGDTVNYIVEHYKASNDGYMLEETEYLGGKIGTDVTAEPKIYTGYTYNPNAVGSVTRGTLIQISSAADIVTLKLYYDLTIYNVTVENDGNGLASAAPVSATMGEKITLTSTPNSDYHFKEWQIVSGNVTISGDVFTMPAGNVTVKALFERESGSGSSGGRGSSSDRDTSSAAIRKDPIKGRTSSDRGIMTGAANSTANDGYSHWMQDAHGWWLRFADNSYPKGQKHGTSGIAYAWEYINGNWWAFDENGYAKTGWLKDEAFGGWFYIDPERGMQTGWFLIDGVWYYFHPVSDGRKGIMYAGQKTPDGYYVDESGACGRV